MKTKDKSSWEGGAMDKTEKLLRSLFDLQHFEKNERLDKVIHGAEDGESGLPLDDSQLEFNAAGEPEAWRIRTGEDDKQ